MEQKQRHSLNANISPNNTLLKSFDQSVMDSGKKNQRDTNVQMPPLAVTPPQRPEWLWF